MSDKNKRQRTATSHLFGPKKVKIKVPRPSLRGTNQSRYIIIPALWIPAGIFLRAPMISCNRNRNYTVLLTDDAWIIVMTGLPCGVYTKYRNSNKPRKLHKLHIFHKRYYSSFRIPNSPFGLRKDLIQSNPRISYQNVFPCLTIDIWPSAFEILTGLATPNSGVKRHS